MANKIILKKSSVTSKVPTTGDLEYGELAINYADGKLYYKTSTNTIAAFNSGISTGSVTSVDVSGGTTGLTTTGGPITSTGTISITGTLAIAHGGTGATTAGDAITALLPTQTTSTNQVLKTNGTTATWSNLSVTNVLYVTKGGNDTLGDGSITNPFLTIDAALTYASTAYPVSNNSGTQLAILLGPGLYTENVSLTRPLTHIFGTEGKLKNTMITGTVTVNPSVDYGGIFQNTFSLNDLFINGNTSYAVNLAGTIQCSLDINSCYLYTASASATGFYVSSTASGGNRLRLNQSEVTTVGNAVAVDISNTTNCVINTLTVGSASTTDAIKLSGTITINFLLATSATASNILNVTSGTINIGNSAFTNSAANGNGINIAAGATVVSAFNVFNIAAGSGKAITGSAGSVYARSNNTYVTGTNSSIGSSVTVLNMPSEVAGTDIVTTVPTSVGGTGLTTFTAANRALYSTSSSALVAGTLPVAAGGTGQTSFSSGYIKSNGTTLSSTATITAADVSGVVSAASAVQNTGAVSSTATHYIAFVANNTTSTQALNTNSSISYNPSTGVLTANGYSLSQGANNSAALLTTSTSTNQVLDTVDSTTYRTAKYILQVSSGSAYQSSEVLMIHDDVNAFLTEYTVVKSTTATLATFSAALTGTEMQLLVTPANAITSIRAIRTVVNV